jgi:hypothetical protein
VQKLFCKKKEFQKRFWNYFSSKKIVFKWNCIKKDKGKVVMRLGRRIGINGSRQWVGAGMRDEIK